MVPLILGNRFGSMFSCMCVKPLRPGSPGLTNQLPFVRLSCNTTVRGRGCLLHGGFTKLDRNTRGLIRIQGLAGYSLPRRKDESTLMSLEGVAKPANP